MKRRECLGVLSVAGLSGCLQFTKGDQASSTGSDFISWEFDGDTPFSNPVADSGRVYVGTAGQTVYAITIATGEVVWEIDSDNFNSTSLEIGTPLITADHIYITTDNDLMKVDKESGNIIHHLRGYQEIPSPELATISDDVIIRFDNDGVLSAYSDLGGSQLWQSGVSSGYGRSRRPVVGQDTILFGTVSDYVDTPDDVRDKDTKIFALDRETGELRWEFIPDEFVGQSRGVRYTIIDDTAVIVDDEATIYGLSVSTGDRLWTHSINRRGSGNIGVQPIPFDEHILIVSGDVSSVDIDTGEERWVTSIDAINSSQFLPTTQDQAWIPTGDYFEPNKVTTIDTRGEVINSHTVATDFETIPTVIGSTGGSTDGFIISHVDNTLRAYLP